MEARFEDWSRVLDALERNDAVAIAKVTRLIRGWLARAQAYQERDSWEDLIQDTLAAIVDGRRKGAIRDERAFVSYVGVIVRRRIFRRREAAERPGSPNRLPVTDRDGPDPELAQPEMRADDVSLRLDLQKALQGLSTSEAEAIHAIYMEGWSYAEASERLGVPLGTLKRRQTRALKRVREAMDMDVLGGAP